ncbi:cytochrome P450 [Rhodoferax ferrireducens]|uniref:Cytochrome P450 n=1 Tax=Rhodoferax ferrireducens TaxID=192843 RepID=A0ABU2C848_9BURK|nr:cytochrome P450 [Rhodoferax ferrireducens]MDR7377503.1 cytochrome P450 [Rhodoferax ferrireducens]
MSFTLLPPGPRQHGFGLPLLRQMRRDYLGLARQMHTTYGDAVYTRIGHERTYEFFHPELVREVLLDPSRSFIRWERGTQVFAEVHGQSVLVTEGDTWQRQRRMLQPGFGPKRMAGYAQHMAAAAAQALDALPPQAQQTVDYGHLMTQLTMDVVLRTLFSQQIQAAGRQESLAAEQAVQVLSRLGMEEFFWPASLPYWLPHKWPARRAKRTLDTLVRRHIQQRRAEPPGVEKTDLLGMLIAVRDEAGDQGALSEQEIHDQCMTIFLAGHETTASALTWWGHCMASQPACAQRAQEEVDRVLGQRPPRYEDLPALPYLAQTLKESLRLYPPAASLISRRATRPVQVGPWQLPRGALVRITPWVLQHDARWFPEPERFDPERFSDAGQAAQVRGSYLPFGAGPRVCIGNLFAMTEMQLVAAMLLQRFQLTPVAGPPPQPVLNVTLRPAQGLRLQLQRR